MLRTTSAGLAIAAIALAAQAQITITNSVFPVLGDQLHYANGNQPNAINAVYTPPGFDQVWDLSGLQASSTLEEMYRDPLTGVGSANFPGAELYVDQGNDGQGQEDYLNVTSTVVELMGSWGVDPLQLGSSWVVRWTPPITERWAPVNFFDIQSVASNSLTYFLPGEMPAGWSAQFPTNDSLRVRIAINDLAAVEASGTMTIPGGTYAVLRAKHTRYTETRVDAKIAPLGWLDVTDVCINQYGMGASLGLDTTVTFHFLNDVSKETIAVCTLNNAQNEVVGVRYKLVDFSTAAEGPAPAAAAARVHPNPATDRIRIQAPQLQPGTAELLVLDAMGRQVLRHRAAPGAPAGQVELDIAALPPGVYQGAILPGTGGRCPSGS